MDDEQAKRIVQRTANQVFGRLLRIGVPAFGAWQLGVRGRRSGEWRTVPVNPVSVKGGTYLVAPRGVTDWVRNLRDAGEGELQHGRSASAFTAREIKDADKPDVLRVYLQKWRWQVRAQFTDVDANSPAKDLLDVADRYPVFRIEWVKAPETERHS